MQWTASTTIRTLPDHQIITLARQGNSFAGEEILSRYQSIIHGVCSRFYLPGGERSDMESHCLMGLWHAVQEFQVERGTDFKLFATYCVQRHAMNAIRAANRGKHVLLNEAGDLESIAELHHDTPADFEEKRLLAMEIEQLLHPESDFLSDLERKVAQARIDGWTIGEIATSLHETPKVVSVIWQRVRQRIRHQLAAPAPECPPDTSHHEMVQKALFTLSDPPKPTPKQPRIARKRPQSPPSGRQLSLF